MNCHWNDYARHWQKLAPPLRPHPEDVELLRKAISPELPVLLLGVTPEISCLPLRGFAIDKSQGMIRSVWNRPPGWMALQGDWLQLPFASGSIPQVLGDGALNVLKFPEDYALLLCETARVSGAAGKIILRQFVSPSSQESLETIRGAALANRIGNFHILKWHVAMAIAAEAPNWNVQVQDIRQVFNQLFDDREQLLNATGWGEEVFDTVDIYAGSSSILSFPSWDALLPLLQRVANRIDMQTGIYELNERCHTITLSGLHPHAI